MGHKVSTDELEHYTRLALERGGMVNGKAAEYGKLPKSAKLRTTQLSPTSLVESAVILRGKTLTLLVGVETASEVNQRDWKARSRRSGKAWKAVRKALGPRLALLAPFAEAFHAGKALRVALTRLGGKRRLDKGNLPSALKGCEDALAFLIGADDGDARWCAEWAQELGGPKVGVRIEVTVLRTKP